MQGRERLPRLISPADPAAPACSPWRRSPVIRPGGPSDDPAGGIIPPAVHSAAPRYRPVGITDAGPERMISAPLAVSAASSKRYATPAAKPPTSARVPVRRALAGSSTTGPLLWLRYNA